MVWWAPLAIAGGKMLLDKVVGGGGDKKQAPPQIAGPLLPPVQTREIDQSQPLIDINQSSTAQPPAPIQQPQAQAPGFFGDFMSPFGDSNMLAPAEDAPMTPQQQMMWVKAGGNIGNLVGQGLSRLF